VVLARAPPPSLPYEVDTSRPSLRTNWTRLVMAGGRPRWRTARVQAASAGTRRAPPRRSRRAGATAASARAASAPRSRGRSTLARASARRARRAARRAARRRAGHARGCPSRWTRGMARRRARGTSCGAGRARCRRRWTSGRSDCRRACGGATPPPPLPPSRTKWTRLVHLSVLIGHVSSRQARPPPG